MEETTIVHPSFAMARFSRVHSGAPNRFFASDVDCRSWIELSINKACEYYRNGEKYPSTHFNGRGEYIRVAFTPSQFAELLTTLNVGDGSPCTIKRLDNQCVEDIPDNFSPNSLDYQKQLYKDSMEEFNLQVKNSANEVNELLKKKTLSKADKEKIKDVFNYISTQVNSNIPYFFDTFKETTDKIVNHAKSEIDATLQHCIVDAGVKALGVNFNKEAKQIEDKDQEEIN